MAKGKDTPIVPRTVVG